MSQPKEVVKQIRRATRRKFSAEDKIRIILEGLRGKVAIFEVCRREGIGASVYYKWSKSFLEAGKRLSKQGINFREPLKIHPTNNKTRLLPAP